jgi:N-acyl-L-homoserine lactone synthetase
MSPRAEPSDDPAVTATAGRAPVDALGRRAAAALRTLAPLDVDLARTPADRDAVLRLRYDCVVEQGWARPEDHPDGVERDEYDDEAVHVVGRDGGGLVGALRIVLPSPRRPLPTEAAFGIRARPAGQVPEVGRIVVARPVRPGRSHLVLAGLCARAWLELSARGYDRALSTAAPDVLELYRSLGMRLTVLGPARLHWGSARVPVQVEGDEQSFAFLGERGTRDGCGAPYR